MGGELKLTGRGNTVGQCVVGVARPIAPNPNLAFSNAPSVQLSTCLLEATGPFMAPQIKGVVKFSRAVS